MFAFSDALELWQTVLVQNNAVLTSDNHPQVGRVSDERQLAMNRRIGKNGLASRYSSSKMRRVKVEHFALQVPDPVAMADWYVEHLGCTVARSGGPPINGRFLLDSAGSVMLEIYRNPKAAIPDFYAIDPLWIHLALVSDNPVFDRERLVKAGAQVVEDLVITPGGDEIIMLRDPWGIPVQLVKRAQPMVWEG